MMFMVQCLDKPDSLALRQETRPAHLEHLKGYLTHVIAAGPLLADDGETPVGSGYVLEFPDKPAVEAFFAADPYIKAGLYREVAIRPYRKVLP